MAGTSNYVIFGIHLSMGAFFHALIHVRNDGKLRK